jgi:hypothetical protein
VRVQPTSALRGRFRAKNTEPLRSGANPRAERCRPSTASSGSRGHEPSARAHTERRTMPRRVSVARRRRANRRGQVTDERGSRPRPTLTALRVRTAPAIPSAKRWPLILGHSGALPTSRTLPSGLPLPGSAPQCRPSVAPVSPQCRPSVAPVSPQCRPSVAPVSPQCRPSEEMRGARSARGKAAASHDDHAWLWAHPHASASAGARARDPHGPQTLCSEGRSKPERHTASPPCSALICPSFVRQLCRWSPLARPARWSLTSARCRRAACYPLRRRLFPPASSWG